MATITGVRGWEVTGRIGIANSMPGVIFPGVEFGPNIDDWTLTAGKTDLTAKVRQGSVKMGGRAFQVEGSPGSFTVDDDDGTVELVAHQKVAWIYRTATTDIPLARARVAKWHMSRGDHHLPNARQIEVHTNDINHELQGIRITAWARPAEPGVSRLAALRDDYLRASPRTSTILDVRVGATGTYTTLDAKTYTGTDPAEVVRDVMRGSDIAPLTAWVTVHHGVVVWPSNGEFNGVGFFNSTFSITDSSPDHVTSFPPIDPKGLYDGTEVLTGVRVVGNTFHSTSSSSAAAEHWEEYVYDHDITSSSDATNRRLAIMAERGTPEAMYTCAVQLTAAQTALIQHGWTISFRSAAAGVTTPTTVRVTQLIWENPAPDVYIAHLELAGARKYARRNRPKAYKPEAD